MNDTKYNIESYEKKMRFTRTQDPSMEICGQVYILSKQETIFFYLVVNIFRDFQTSSAEDYTFTIIKV